MCGRFYIPNRAIESALSTLPDALRAKAQRVLGDWIADLNRPRYDVRPTNLYPVVTDADVLPMRWGFRTAKSGAVFNARSESMGFPLWRDCLARHRAVVAAGGFFEWTGEKGRKQAHAIQHADGAPMLLAALWADDPELGPCFSIVTTPASAWMKPLHSRMPLILAPASAARWLRPGLTRADAKALMKPFDGELSEFACASPSNGQAPTPVTGSTF